MSDLAQPGHPSVSGEQMQAFAALLATDPRQTIRELGQEIKFSPTTVLNIQNSRLRMRKTASRRIAQDLMEAQRWI